MKIIKIGAIWCPGCLVMKKVWKSIVDANPDLLITEYDLDMNKEEVAKYNPGTVLPVTIFMDENDKELERVIGEVKEEKLQELIDRYRG